MDNIESIQPFKGKIAVVLLTWIALITALLSFISPLYFLGGNIQYSSKEIILQFAVTLLNSVGCVLFLLYISKFYMKRTKPLLLSLSIAFLGAGYLLNAVDNLTTIIIFHSITQIPRFVLYATIALLYALSIRALLYGSPNRKYIVASFTLSVYCRSAYVYYIWYIMYNWWGSVEYRIIIVSNIAALMHAIIFPLAILIFCLKNKIPSVLTKASIKTKKD